jgi:drug/metabolite transporter (DMT)-like permease
MGIFFVFLAALLWSFVGILVKYCSFYVDNATITFSRFFFGVLLLGAFIMVRDKKISFHFQSKWIWIGVIGKSCNYVLENIALSMGHSYGNILVPPLQSVFLLLVSVFYFKESVSLRSWIAAILCVAGVFLVSWNGLSFKELFQTDGMVTFLFIIAAIGSSFHFLSQKILVQQMESAKMNFCTFLWCSCVVAMPLPFQMQIYRPLNLWVVLSLVFLGFITGISFYFFSEGLKRTKFTISIIISNSMILFSILWAKLFYNETLTVYVITGAVLFFVGIIIMNGSMKKERIRMPVVKSVKSNSNPFYTKL